MKIYHLIHWFVLPHPLACVYIQFLLSCSALFARKCNPLLVIGLSFGHVSGASSASSASRKNGTGASAAGSGSGSIATAGRVTSRLPPSGANLADPCKRPAVPTTRLPVSISGRTGSVGELVPQTAPPVPSHALNTTCGNKTGSLTKTGGTAQQQQQRWTGDP